MVNDTEKHNLRRRSVLAAAGTGATMLALSGCLGGGSSNDDNGDDGGNDDNDGNGGTDFPEDDIEMVVPWGPGGGYDTYSRITARHLSEELGISVQVQNVEGGEGQIGLNEVLTAEPDGYTNMIVHVGSYGIRQVMEDVDYDIREIAYTAQCAESVPCLCVGADRDVETFDEYVTAMQNEELTIGTNGLTNQGTIFPVLIGELGGEYPTSAVTDNLVIYDGRGPMIPAMERGDIDVMGGAYSSLLPFVESGDLRMILAGTMQEEPPSATPDADTMVSADIDQGQRITDMITNIRVFGTTPSVPDDRLEILRDAYEAVLTSDDLLEEADEQGRPVTFLSGEETAQRVTGYIDGWEENRDLLESLMEEEE